MARTLEEVLKLALELPEEQRLRLAQELYEGLSPHPELASQEPGYDEWVREQVQASLDDPSPDIPHEEAMKRFHEAIQRARKLKETA